MDTITGVKSWNQQRKITLDHMIDEKFGEIFFLAKDEYDISNNTAEEKKLYALLMQWKTSLKRNCEEHFGEETNEDN